MDRETILVIFTGILVAYVAWIDVRTFLHKKKNQAADSESYHAKQAQLYQKFIDICNRQEQARARLEESKNRREREYLKATGHAFAYRDGGRT